MLDSICPFVYKQRTSRMQRRRGLIINKHVIKPIARLIPEASHSSLVEMYKVGLIDIFVLLKTENK